VTPIRTFVFVVQERKGLNFCMGYIIRLEFFLATANNMVEI
jgi:hypothetical protein